MYTLNRLPVAASRQTNNTSALRQKQRCGRGAPRRPQWTRKRRTQGAQADARLPQRMQERTAPRPALYITHQLCARTRSVHWWSHSRRIARGPPRVHEREKAPLPATTHRTLSTSFLQGFLRRACPR
jgi:hypothetical protein